MSLYGDIKGTHNCNKWQVDIVTSASDQGERCLYRGFSWVVPTKSWMAYRDYYFYLISFQHPLCFPKILQKPKRSKSSRHIFATISVHITLSLCKYYTINDETIIIWIPSRIGSTFSNSLGWDSTAWPWSPGAPGGLKVDGCWMLMALYYYMV